MKYPGFKVISTCCLLAATGIVFSSCTPERKTEVLRNATLKESLDFGKLHESGASNIHYNYLTKVNTIVYTETSLGGEFSVYGEGSVDNNLMQYGSALSPDKTQQIGFASIGFGLEYIGKGAKFPGGDGKVSLNYLEVPIHFLYHYIVGKGNAYGGLGPFFSYGIGGKEGDVSSFGENNGGFKRFDAGLGFMLGYKLNMGLSLDLNYDLGLANIEYASEDVKGHSRCISINVGYQVGRLFMKKK